MVNFGLVAGLVLSAFMASPSLATPVFDMAEGFGGMGTPVRLTTREPTSHDLYYSNGNTWLASSGKPGEPGDVVVGYKKGLYTFYTQFGQLYQAANYSSVLYVNVVNVTDSGTTKLDPNAPQAVNVLTGSIGQAPSNEQVTWQRDNIHTRVPAFKLMLSPRQGGIQGEWVWNEMEGALHFRSRGSNQLKGNFYSCADRKNGRTVIHVDLDPSLTYPVTCTAIKLVRPKDDYEELR